MILESLIATACLAAGPHINTTACSKAVTAASMQTGSYHLIEGTEEYYRRKTEDVVGRTGVVLGTITYMAYKFVREDTVAHRIGFGLRLEVSQHSAGIIKEWKF